MWEPFLVLALAVSAWRWLSSRRPRQAHGPLHDVGTAPPDAEPVLRPRLDDNGLATYSLRPPGRPASSRGEPTHGTG